MENIKFETVEQMYRRLLKSAAKKSSSHAEMQMEVDTEDWLAENDPSYDEDPEMEFHEL